MRPERPTARRPLLKAGQAWLLAGLLLLAQGLGLVHGVSHGLAAGSAPGLSASAPACHEDHGAHGHTHGAAHPAGFAAAHAHGGAHEAGDAQCRLIDQLAHADGLFSAASPPGLPPPGQPAPATAPRLALAEGGSAAYLARAPPRG